MEKCAEAAAAENPSQCISFQVVFIDIPHSYPPAAPVTCCYTVTAFQPSNKDWVGVFKVGWSTTRDYYTYVWVDPCQDVKGHQSEIRQAVFNDYYLPKDEIDFYQFCYVDSAGQVRGASTPFRFRKSAEQNRESCLDENKRIVTTQEQLEQNTREKDEMQKELNHLLEENETLRSALSREGQASASLKRQNEQKEKENAQVVEELAQIKQDKGNLNTLEQQPKETKHSKGLKQTAQPFAAEQERLGVSLEPLYKELEEMLKVKLKLDQLKVERAELKVRPETQGQEMEEQLKDMQVKLVAAMEESKNMKKSAEQLKEELLQVKEKLDNVMSSYEDAQQKSGRQEAELREAHKVIADKVATVEEKERLIAMMSNKKKNLTRLNRDLIDDLELLCRICKELRTAPPAGSQFELVQHDATEDANIRHHPEMSEESENLGAVTGPEEEQLC